MRILLVDRDELAKPQLKAALQSSEFDVDVADLQAGADVVGLSSYAAIILGLSGFGDTEAVILRTWHERAPLLPLIALLAPEATVDERVNCLNAGADGYVLRPADPREVAARLRALERRKTLGELVVRTHDLEIDVRSRQVRRSGRIIPLTPREFALLNFLARRQGRTVSRATIWENLYDGGGAANSNIIDVYIRYLRRKIDRGFDTPLILTFRGQGYQLRGNAC